MNNSTVNSPETSSNSTTQSVAVKNAEIILYSIGFLFGLPTHSYIIWLIVTGTASGIASEFFILNLSVCEIGGVLNGLITILTGCFSSLLTISNFFQGLGITGRPLFQCLICVERYLAVGYPVSFLKYKPLRYRVICCAVVWIITLASCLGCMFILFSSLVAYPWFFSLQYLLLFSIQFFCLVAVLRALKLSGPGERARDKVENHMKRRAFHLILITTVSAIIIYIPVTITVFINMILHKTLEHLWITAVVCFVLAGFVQPVLYLHRAGKLSWLCS